MLGQKIFVGCGFRADDGRSLESAKALPMRTPLAGPMMFQAAFGGETKHGVLACSD
jgi:hypothetical protein